MWNPDGSYLWQVVDREMTIYRDQAALEEATSGEPEEPSGTFSFESVGEHIEELVGVNAELDGKPLTGEDEPAYTAIYEIDSPDVLLSPSWQEAAEAGRWASEVRPYTKNRRHVVRRVL